MCKQTDLSVVAIVRMMSVGRIDCCIGLNACDP